MQAGWLGLFDEKEEKGLPGGENKNAARTLSSFEDYSRGLSKDTPVNPLGRRDVDVSVKTGWPTTVFSPLCEAWSYLDAGSSDKNSLSWKYLDVFADLGGSESLDRWIDEPKDEYSWGVHNSSLLALEVAAKVDIGALDHNLLPLALSLRAHSPHCEMHRSLARDASISFGLYNTSEPGNLPDAFAIISKTGVDEITNQTKVMAAQVVMDGVLVSNAIESLHSIGDDSRHIAAGYSKLLLPLSDEIVNPGSDSDGGASAVVYGQVGTSAFASMYQSFKNSNIAFVVRHMGYIQYEEDSPTSPKASRTKLQGYGVRLDIRNIEYKAFDEPDDGNDDSDVDLSDAGHDPSEASRDEYLAGINLHRILRRLEADGRLPLDTDLNAMQTGIIQSQRAQQRYESIIPPAWQRRPLSMQATTIVLSSPDPLGTLKGLSQNLPSIAHFLASVRVPPSLEKLAEDATALASRVGAVSPGWGDAAFGLYVNSNPVDVERPSFNVFQLLSVIREEDKKLRELESRVRPVLKFASESLGSSSDWKTLLAVRNAMDMGMDKLKQIGNNLSGAMVESELYGDKELPVSKKYRIDVGRGGKNAVLYLNDIEKDPEYRSWPSSLQEMLMRSQYGGAPTVRRNLFTLLVVMDPASGVAQPSLSVAAQLMNSQVPLRIGVLIVNENDVANGLASPHPSWNDGQRRFHARDSSLILRFLAKEFGGLTSFSCLVQMSHMSDTDITVSEYIDKHVAFLNEMGVVQGMGVRYNLEAIVKSGKIDSVTKRIDITYEQAVSFASDKLIAPGMSFFNGLPLPDASDRESFGAAVNEIFSYEQQNIMELVVKGIISDGPKSVYAAVLRKGDNLFKQFHPLLRESEGVYFALDSSELDSDVDSLLVPSSPSISLEEVRALYLIEAFVDFESTEGVGAAIALMDINISPPEAWYESKTAVASKISPSGPVESPGGLAMFNILRSVSQFNASDVKAALLSLLPGNFDSTSDVAAVINQLEQVDKEVRQKLIDVVSAEHTKVSPSPRPEKNFYIANGRVFVPPKGRSISISDIEMLIDLEYDLSSAFSHLVLPKLVGEVTVGGGIPPATYLAMGKAASVLFEMLSQPTSRVQDFTSVFDSVDEDSPLFFSWNEESDDEHLQVLQVKVSCILDPLTEPTQRVAPILMAIRDSLKIPLRLLLAPRLTVSNELPLSSYYRFVVDADSEDPKASFHNLPTNHLLTLRMDVPEIFDVQQSSAVEDADNLRCIPPFGCGDKAHLLAKGQVPKEGAQAGPTRIEYQLKNLLFFGQCHDLLKNTSPNGLQLTLDRSSIINPSSPSAVEIDGKGVISSSLPSASMGSRKEHADTLVMKTVGYWQLRANPGVWELKIAKHSRGSQIFDMVEGTATATGRLKLKRSQKMESKTLSMKDFTNQGRVLTVLRKKGFEQTELYEENTLESTEPQTRVDTVHVFSLATGHAYERLLKIMMLSVTKRTTSPVKFWLFENFLSPSFKSSAKYMAEQIGCEVTFVTYKWPEWLRGQSEKQRLIWGYKILFLDVLFPLSVKKIIYVDADQVIRGDLTELANLDLEGAPYGYTPMCDSRVENRGYAFWRTGFWEAHLRGKPYHISALYVVDLERFRRELVGDKLRAIYQQLSADPNSLANLDQDLPNYAQHEVRIFSLPQKWLWCESWCSDETKIDAMTIDLCNNPEHKEAKITMAKRIISGPLFEESWEELDKMVGQYDKEYLDNSKTR